MAHHSFGDVDGDAADVGAAPLDLPGVQAAAAPRSVPPRSE